MQPKYKSLLIRILIAIAVDVLLLSIFIIWMHPTPEESILEYLLLLAIFVINIGFAVVSKYIMKLLYLPFILNSVIAVVIFHLLFKGWYAYNDHKNFKRMLFTSANKKYELLLDIRDTSHSFLKIGSSNKFMGGEYKINNDSIYLIDNLSPMIVYKDTLIGFAKEKIVLK